MKTDIKKIVLAYSGGLDTSVMLRWLKAQYHCEVVCFCADVGQGAELEGLEEKALATGASKLYVEDLREEFVRDYVWTAVKANAVYEGVYLMGTSLARPVIACRDEAKEAQVLGSGRRIEENAVTKVERVRHHSTPFRGCSRKWCCRRRGSFFVGRGREPQLVALCPPGSERWGSAPPSQGTIADFGSLCSRARAVPREDHPSPESFIDDDGELR